MRTLLVLAALSLGCTACADTPLPGCREGPRFAVRSLVLTAPTPGAVPVQSDVTVRGRLVVGADVTVFKLFVAGIAASNDGFGYDEFSATVPLAVLQSLAPPNPDGGTPAAQLQVDAVTNCTGSLNALTPLGALDVPVLAKAARSLQLTSSALAVPNSVATPVLLQIKAPPDAAGASVSLSASLGSINGQASPVSVTLAGNGVDAATASAVFLADPSKEGDAEIVASSVTAAAQAIAVHTVAPPHFWPQVSLVPGQQTVVTVSSRGTVSGCRATPAPGFAVKSGPADLTAGGQLVTLVDSQITIDVSASATSTTTLLCEDSFGQFAQVSYAVRN